tara:strand:- start:55894 stop:57540 length:1647 start_codon:yes stop_codon:yes gene_type:complete
MLNCGNLQKKTSSDLADGDVAILIDRGSNYQTLKARLLALTTARILYNENAVSFLESDENTIEEKHTEFIAGFNELESAYSILDSTQKKEALIVRISELYEEDVKFLTDLKQDIESDVSSYNDICLYYFICKIIALAKQSQEISQSQSDEKWSDVPYYFEMCDLIEAELPEVLPLTCDLMKHFSIEINSRGQVTINKGFDIKTCALYHHLISVYDGASEKLIQRKDHYYRKVSHLLDKELLGETLSKNEKAVVDAYQQYQAFTFPLPIKFHHEVLVTFKVRTFATGFSVSDVADALLMIVYGTIDKCSAYIQEHYKHEPEYELEKSLVRLADLNAGAQQKKSKKAKRKASKAEVVDSLSAAASQVEISGANSRCGGAAGAEVDSLSVVKSASELSRDKEDLKARVIALDKKMSCLTFSTGADYAPSFGVVETKGERQEDTHVVRFLEKLVDRSCLGPTLAELKHIAKRLGGTVERCGSGASHYKLAIGISYAYFNMRHRSGSVERTLSPLAVKNVTFALQRADIFTQHGIELGDVVATSTARKHGAGR